MIRYVNQTNKVVKTVDEHGKQVLFRPRQSSSRTYFANVPGLTAVETPDRYEVSGHKSNTLIPAWTPPVEPLSPLPIVDYLTKDYEHYSTRCGIWKCKRCMFRTGSFVSLQRHITQHHDIEVQRPEEIK